MYWHQLEATEGSINWMSLDNALSWCAKYGFYVIIDMHQYQYSPYFSFTGGMGFPSWLVAAGGYANSESGQQAFSDDLFLKRGYGSTSWMKFVNFWSRIINRYKSNSSIWAYEILNEPLTGTSHATGVNLACYDRYKEIIPMMRTNDPNTIIICHDVFYSKQAEFIQNCQSVTPLPYPNLCWTRSYYPQYEGGNAISTIDSKLNTLKAGVNDIFKIPHLVSESGLQPVNSGYSQGIINLDDRYRAILNGGTGAIHNWWYARGTKGGFQGPRNSDGSDSWMQPILATWIAAQPVIRTLALQSTLQIPWTVNGVVYQGDHILQLNQGSLVTISAPSQVIV